MDKGNFWVEILYTNDNEVICMQTVHGRELCNKENFCSFPFNKRILREFYTLI